jgi:dipeptidase
MASTNIHSLAEELGLWEKGVPFVWRDVYGTSGSSYNSLREWRALSLAAPSLALQFTADPDEDQYPFSVKPDQPFTVPRLMTLMRDGYEGTQFDVTEHPAFNPEGKQSPLARPWGPPELFDLLGIEAQRALCTPTSGYVFVAQLRDWLPNSFGNCLWFAYGPAYTSCFAPIYAGITDLPNAWDQAPDYTRIRRDQVPWNFRLVHSLANNLRYQPALRDIRRVFEPAEAAFLANQKALEDRAATILRDTGDKGLEHFLNSYAEHCLTQVGHAYHELVDCLMFKYLVDHAEVAMPNLPTIAPPFIPGAGKSEPWHTSPQASQPSTNQEFK